VVTIITSHRTDNRYPLKAEAAFSWRSPERSYVEGAGTTHDLSANGAFIETTDLPLEGSPVHIQLRVRISGDEILHLKGNAVVIRTTGTGFAVRKNLATWAMKFEKVQP